MGGRGGGTGMYCPRCGTVRVCQAVSTREVAPRLRSGQRWRKLGHSDLQFFRRGRRCQTCMRAWLSVEILESQLDELVELREALADLKANAEDYIEQSDAAADSLTQLKESLDVLRALKVYRDA